MNIYFKACQLLTRDIKIIIFYFYVIK